MDQQKRLWTYREYTESAERTSKETVAYFKRTNEAIKERIERTLATIAQLEQQRDELVKQFNEKYDVTFEEAKELEENAWHSERDFNLEDFHAINQLEDQINGEKFVVYQRERLIKKNEEVINDIENWYKRAKEKREEQIKKLED